MARALLLQIAGELSEQQIINGLRVPKTRSLSASPSLSSDDLAFVQKMRGKKGSEVSLSIYRDGWEKIRDIKIARAEIKVQSVKSEELEPGNGYVRLSNFNENAAQGWQLKTITSAEVKGRVGPGGVEGLLVTFERQA